MKRYGVLEDIRKPIRILLNLMTLPDMIIYECVCVCASVCLICVVSIFVCVRK